MIPPEFKKEKIICIVGPTAIGKTSMSIRVARAVNGEVVSADSRQVYRGLDIGSGKVTPEEMSGVPHHMLDVADPQDVFTAAHFVEAGRAAIADIVKRGRVPIVVGGTGFYIDALVGRVALADVPPNEEMRNALHTLSVNELRARLQQLDPDVLQRMDTQNPVRLIRAIEIATALGKVELKKGDEPYTVLWVGLMLPIDEIKQRIQARLLARLESGMLEEARKLHANGLTYARMEQLGLEYRAMARHLNGTITFDEMEKELISEIGKYAKRQMTWFKKNTDIQWFAPHEGDAVLHTVRAFLL
jgi:tRNA dimethylallyltransferase